MNLRDYIATFGGHIGLVTFLTSIILFFAGNKEIALIIDTFTLVTLNPCVLHHSYWAERSDYSRVPLIWFGKFGTMLSLVSLINLVWYTFLVYLYSDSILMSILSFLFIILLLPTILSYFMIKKNEYK